MLPTPLALYLEVEPFSATVTNKILIAGTSFVTTEPTWCPITTYNLYKGGAIYDYSCATFDPLTKDVIFTGIFCLNTNMKLEIATSGGGGAIIQSGLFDIEVRVNCLPHLSVPTPALTYFQKTPFANTVLGMNILNFASFTSADIVNCPIILPASMKIYQSGILYTGSCILVSPAGEIEYGGVFCNEIGF